MASHHQDNLILWQLTVKTESWFLHSPLVMLTLPFYLNLQMRKMLPT